MSISPHLLDIVLLVLLIAAALWDMSTRLIPNLLVGTGLCWPWPPFALSV